MVLICDIETSGLDPTVDFITMVGKMDNDGVNVFSAPASDFRNDPYAAEDNLLHRLSAANFSYTDLLITYNGFGFDLPFLTTRLMAHKIPPPAFIGIKKHLDLMLFATHINGGSRISKDMAASKYCNLYVARNSSGIWLAQIYNQKIVSDTQHVEAMGHNLQDLMVTYKMLEVWKTFPSFEKFYSAKYPDIKEWLYAK
jgi:DNA polymerase elongation subunit (family B)